LQVVIQHVAIAWRHPVIGDYSLQSANHFIEFLFLVAVRRQSTLQFIQFLFRPHQSEFVAAAEGSGLNAERG
jgi:hypothetical protein